MERTNEIDKILEMINSRLDALEAENNSQPQNEEIDFDKEMEKLNSLIGLDEVKNEVNKLINYLKFVQKIKDKVNLDKINLNMVFKGNPGTGKTTVARIMANLLYSLGFLENNLVKEATPRDFIAGYVGKTALKSKKLLDKYKGGVIFVDEAYSFNHEKGEMNYSDEAIAEIIKEMENKNTVFIFSGYNKEMDDFINLNQGLKSRVGYIINFNDYTEEELLEIFNKKLEKDGFKIYDTALEEIKNIIKAKKQEKNFGNGRMIDNLYNKILLEHASLNYEEDDEEKLLTITTDAVNNVDLKIKRSGYFE